MSDYKKHLSIMKEKLETVINAYKNKRNSVIGDEATKVVEQLVEADAARNNVHMHKHYDRHQYINKNYPHEVQLATKRVWSAYKDLGYDGLNGGRAKMVVYNLKKVLVFFEGLLNEKFITKDYPDVN